MQNPIHRRPGLYLGKLRNPPIVMLLVTSKRVQQDGRRRPVHQITVALCTHNGNPQGNLKHIPLVIVSKRTRGGMVCSFVRNETCIEKMPKLEKLRTRGGQGEAEGRGGRSEADQAVLCPHVDTHRELHLYTHL